MNREYVSIYMGSRTWVTIPKLTLRLALKLILINRFKSQGPGWWKG